MSDRFTATYLIETAHDLEKAANIMAGEQSAGTFMRVHGETDELRAAHGARVERLTELGTVESPSLPCARHAPDDAVYRRAEVVISFPFVNVGANLPVFMTTVSGNLYELAPFSGLKLLDITVPEQFADAYPGPQFGVAGTRELTSVDERPIIGTIVKPSVGLSPEQTADLVKMLAAAGLDFVKDDELMADSPHSPLPERVKHVMRAVNDHADRTGKKVMVAFNISGDMDHMLRSHDLILEHGGTCVMVNMLQVGLTGIAKLREHSQLPIHGHRNGWGMLVRHPLLGMEYAAFQKFFRIAGVDHLHVNGLRNKFCESDESVMTSARTCLTPLNDTMDYTAMPVFSSGQWAGQIPDTYEQLDSGDFMYLSGGGIMAHPDGPAAGVRSLKQAWDAAAEGVSLAEHAKTNAALRRAMEKYGVLS